MISPSLSRRLVLLAALSSAAFLLLFSGRALASESWWQLSAGARPAHLPSEAGQEAELFLVAENLGVAPLDAESQPASLSVSLPSGLEATGISGSAPGVHNNPDFLAGLSCSLVQLSCAFEGSLASYASLELRLKVRVEPGAHSGEELQAAVTGGDAPPRALSRPLAFSAEPTPFGLEDFRMHYEEPGGEEDNQAGSHPFQFTTTVAINQGPDTNPIDGGPLNNHRPEVGPVGLAKDSHTKFPPGFLGNPEPLPTCSLAQFLTTAAGAESEHGANTEEDFCPSQTAIGVAAVTVWEPNILGTATLTVPLFNLEPYAGEPARLGFFVAPVAAPTPVLLDTSLRSRAGEGAIPGQGEDYGIDVNTTDITQLAGLMSVRVTTWGTPGDPRHDSSRGWSCLNQELGADHGLCVDSEEHHPPAFLTMPTSCAAPMQGSQEVSSWAQPTLFDLALPSDPLPRLEGCGRLPFAPTIDSEPTADSATSPTGLNFDLDVENEGLTSSKEGALAASEVKKAVVTLPQGFTTNPSVAEGLHACSLAEYEATTIEPKTGCTEESKIGSAEIESPVVSQTVKGSLFVAKQHENPYGNLLTLYLVFKNQELGVLIKQALKVTPDPQTGQLTTAVDDIPQLPFSKFRLSFRQGQRSPLITPPACGTYAVKAKLYPYSEPEVPLEDESSFQITQGPEGQPCPSGNTPPFHPELEAGTINNAAGTYSPFYTHIARKDSEQEITRFSIKLPPGVIGKLAGVSECSDAQIAAAKAREHEGGGAEEDASPSCPANSEVGHSLVGSGVGNVLAYAPGKLYLAGPYHGSPLSLVSITAAKVGPFDLGTVVVRFALDIDHETAEVSVDGAGSDPIPHIVDGIPVHLRDIRAYVDRPSFTLNPTSCARTSTASTVFGSGLDFVSPADDVPVTVTSPFQAADCQSLAFKPKLALSLSGGKTHRGGLPAFKAVLTYPKGGHYANIARSEVILPASEILEQGHLEKVCPKSVFQTGSTPGENCPANSIYGVARAKTPLLEEELEGPVFLRTGYGTKLPELTATLNSKQIHIVLAGKIDAVHKKGSEVSRIRNTFEVVPDAPVERFVLEMRGGSKGLLVNKTNVCRGSHKAQVLFTGQNGKLAESSPPLVASACAKKGK